MKASKFDFERRPVHVRKRSSSSFIAHRQIVMTILSLLLVVTTFTFASQQTSADQENDPEILASLNAINMYRSWLGIKPLSIDSNLQQAAENHAEYYRLNYGDPSLSGMGLHVETPGNPGFTGETMFDRAEAAGYGGYVNENVGLSGSMWWSLNWFVGTINHRLTLIDPRYTDIGMATVSDGDIVFEIIDLGTENSWEYETEPEWVAWPPPGSTGVDLTFSGEAPNPFPGASFPVGYPITLSYHGPGELQLTDWSISINGVEISTFASVGSGWLSSKTAQIAASDPLEAGTTYEVQVRGIVGSEEFTRSWSFTTTTGDDPLSLNGESPSEPSPDQPGDAPPEPTPDPGTLPFTPQLPPGLQFANQEVQQLWWDSDGPVYLDEVNRSWLWGPDTWIRVSEPYADSPTGTREVYYFDKARIEVNDATETEEQSLTAGLLVRDMILGAAQVGDDEFVELAPAQIPLAGDPLEFNLDAPTYASLSNVATINRASDAIPRPGEPITTVIWKHGQITDEPSLAGSAKHGTFESTLGHNIADVFDEYFATLAVDWRISVGLPLAEPYWMRIRLEGEEVWSLVQVFERRVLTFTPSNDPGWKVEMGNVGRHYYSWRYATEPPPIPTPTDE